MSTKRHLIAKLKRLLDDDELEIRLFRRKQLRRPVTGKGVQTCTAWFDGDHTIDVAVLDRDPDDITHGVIHELLHIAGFPEMAIDEALDNVAFSSRALREAVKTRLLEARFNPRRGSARERSRSTPTGEPSTSL